MIERIDLNPTGIEHGPVRIPYVAIHSHCWIDVVGTWLFGRSNARNCLGRLNAAHYLVAVLRLFACKLSGYFHAFQAGLDDLDQIRFGYFISRADHPHIRAKRRKCLTRNEQEDESKQRSHEGRFWLDETPMDF